MIEEIRLVGFQKWTRLSVKFDPHITTIAGPNDTGKTAVVRALRWLCLNKPGGDSFINWDRNKCSVVLKVDGRTVARRKGEENVYELDGKRFISFGSNVPEPIENLLRVDDNNFQLQLDPHFWISDTPGQIAKQLNAIVDLSLIDTTIAQSLTNLRKTKAELEVIKERRTKAKSEWRKHKNSATIATEWDAIKQESDKIAEINATVLSVDKWLVDAKRHRQAIKRAADIARAARILVKTGCAATKLQSTVNSVTKLIEGAKELKKTRRVNFSRTESLGKEIIKQTEEIKQIESIVNKLIQLKDLLCQKRKRLKKLNRSMPTNCPICKSPLKTPSLQSL